MPAAAYGLPALRLTSQIPFGGSPWDTSGSGNPRAYTAFYPFPGSTLILATASNQWLATGAAGMSAVWQLAATAALSAGNFAEVSLLVGHVRQQGLPSKALSVWYAGTNTNGIALAQIPYSNLRVVATASATHSGSGSLVVGPVVAPVAGISVILMQTRSGTATTPAGYTDLQRGSVSGPAVLAWKACAAGESLTATWTGPADNSAGVIVVLAP